MDKSIYDHGLKFVFCLIFITGCAHKSGLNGDVPDSKDFDVKKLSILSEQPLHQDQESVVKIGGLSDLVFDEKESQGDKLVFYTTTDRGPNGKEWESSKTTFRPFLNPTFTPQIIKIVYETKAAQVRVVNVTPLKTESGRALSGLPNFGFEVGRRFFDETPVNSKNEVLHFDPWGVDPEGLAIDDDGNFWLSEEYGPSFLKVNTDGKVLQRWYPMDGDGLKSRVGVGNLPAILADRKLNRGFEALVWTSKKTLLAFLQSEIPLLNRKDLVPVLEFDPVKQEPVGMFFYPLSAEGGKIGAATMGKNGEVLVLEQNGKVGKSAWQRVFSVDKKAADNVLEQAMAKKASFQIPSGIQVMTKKEVLNLSKLELNSFEKLEGLSLTPEGFVVVNDNDFGVGKAPKDDSNSYFFLIREKAR